MPNGLQGSTKRSPENPMEWDKYNRDCWQTNYANLLDFFFSVVHNEPHSTKQHQHAVAWGLESDDAMLAMTQDGRFNSALQIDEPMYQNVQCPGLLIVGDADPINPPKGSHKIDDLTPSEIHLFPGGGHAVHARYPAWFNTQMRDFLALHLGISKPVRQKKSRQPRVLYLSSPIGLGHARRDLAVTRELRAHHPDLQVDWLAQDPVTRFLDANGETVHAASRLLANKSAHIKAASGEHDLNAFQAIQSMDKILIKNFMVFQEVLEEETHDLVRANEAWGVNHFWHEHPELKQAQIAWLSNFVGWVPMPNGGLREAALTTGYNAKMIEHIERNPTLRDQAIFVGGSEDIVDLSFGDGLHRMRDWVPHHYECSHYVIGQHPSEFGTRAALREAFGYNDGQVTCIVSVGGSRVGATLIARILAPTLWPNTAFPTSG